MTISADIKQKAVSEYMSGVPAEQVSKKYGVSNTSIFNWANIFYSFQEVKNRKSYNTNSLKGKNYEEIHGTEVATKLREGRSNSIIGIKRSNETKTKIKKSKLGLPNKFKGKKHTNISKQHMREARNRNFPSHQGINCQVRRFWKVSKWTMDIFERDNFTCQSCGIRNKKGLGKTVKLEAHHIMPLSEIIKGLSFEESIQKYELYDLNNGITLCRCCHKKTHNWKVK